MPPFRPIWLLALGLLAPGSRVAAVAQPDGAHLYTHVMQVTVSGKDGLAQLRLPKDVYLNARSAELNDLRLFDRRGASIPFALTTPQAQENVSVRTVPVTIFPLTAERRAGPANAALEIRSAADGSLVSVNTRVSGNVPASSQLSALVLDMRGPGSAGAPAAPVSALRLTLPKELSNYSARIELEVSDDLKQWDSLGDSLVNWLTNADTKSLANDRIEFEPRAFRYARLSWREGTPVAFSAIEAEFRSQTAVAAPLDTVVIAPSPGKFAGDLAYPSAIALPVRSLALEFLQPNVVVPAVMGHYVELPAIKKGQPKAWQFAPSFNATFYRITQAGRTRSSGELELHGAHAGEWVLRPQAAMASPPSLRLSWQPATMVFLGNGEGPYTLAVGRLGAPRAQLDIARVAPAFSAPELAALEVAVAGPVRQQGVAQSAPGTADLAGVAAQGRQMVLWAVLGLGIIVLGVMTKVLLGQMRHADAEGTG
ncbi:DUF3999 family protein [Massilia sp. R2A-15]|uniref:DUF3999 family protein n=1 Tax=Massilia sp. R2A-15 TaxID=3064278 RepID=UPI002735D765|nr:DUF3999 family protein [Massilia sp. R2A-15]WLI88351.1 DUF3999 family protein [Massilia sp. R2A-15]